MSPRHRDMGPAPGFLDGRIDFSEGATWHCTSCGSSHTIGVDDDDEDTGLPAYYDPSSGTAVCDACAGRAADAEPLDAVLR